MPRNYYYFSSSLPHLVFGAEPPFALKNFLGEAERMLATSDFRSLQLCVRDGQDPGRGAGRAWFVFENHLRNEWAAARAGNKGLHPPDFVRGERAFNPAVQEIIAEAIDEENPLEAEQMIDRLRWSFLDDLEAGHLFDLDRFFIYGLKLRILERYQTIRSPRGGEHLRDIMSSDVIQDTFAKIKL